MLRSVKTTRYVLPLREGGSLPALMEADDYGIYVVKFRGAGQGPLALIAEIIAGEIGRELGLRVPELVLAEVDAAMGRNEPDYEIRHLLKTSVGLNLGLDYLPGSAMFDEAAGDTAPADEASLIVWFDAFTMNVDRTARNANLLAWHGKLHPIDHGAALYFHHDWARREDSLRSSFNRVKEHLLLRWATGIRDAGEIARSRLSPIVFERIVNMVPDQWLAELPDDVAPADRRAGYLEFLTRRLEGSDGFEEEAIRARVV